MPLRKKLEIVTILTLLTLAMLETVFRTYDLDQIRGIVRNKTGEKLSDCLVADAYLDHKLLPNCEGLVKTRDFEIALKTNSLGFRDREFSQKSEKTRIVIVGDSFAEGWGVNVEDRFDQFQSEDYEILNLGTRSYSPFLNERLLEKYIDELKPDMVISMVDFSDLHDDCYYSRRLTPHEPGCGDDRSKTAKFLSSSKLFETVYRQIKVRQSTKNKKINPTNLAYDFALFGKGQDWEGYDKAWDYTRQTLKETSGFLNSKGIDHKIAVVPRGIHVGESEWSEGRVMLGLTKNKLYDASKIFAMSDIDLLTPLVEAEGEATGELYYPFDGHWTEKGHEVVKSVLKNYLDNLYQNTLPNTKAQ